MIQPTPKTKTRFDGLSNNLSINDLGQIVAGETEVWGIEREEILRALNAYMNTKRTVKAAAKFLIYSAIIIGTIAITIYLLSITDVGVLQ